MAITLDATVGGASSNTYATVAEGNTYHEAHVYTDTWDEASTADKNKALAMATRLLDDNVEWNGAKATKEQALRWPRHGIRDEDGYYVDSDVIPQFLKDATAEYARLLLAKDYTAEPDTRGYSEMHLAGMGFTIDKTDRDQMRVVPESVQRMIRHYGRTVGIQSVVKLERV